MPRMAAACGSWHGLSRKWLPAWLAAAEPVVSNVEGRALVRHLDPCRMNVEIDGIPLDAQIGEAKP